MNQKKIKILFFITGLDSGGAEKQLFNLVKGLSVKTNLEIKLVALKNGIYFENFVALGSDVIVFKKTTLFTNNISIFISHIKLFKPDIVHSFLLHTNIISKFSLFFIKKEFKLICSYRTLISKYPLLNTLEFINYKKVDLMISNSKSADSDLVNFKKISKRVILNGFL
ncbi:MAG: hypothetical protein HRU03_05810, partial [Nanoarchaeales archaeon]|nr:hypothetical protein [Nanoarchaeales archaeon]